MQTRRLKNQIAFACLLNKIFFDLTNIRLCNLRMQLKSLLYFNEVGKSLWSIIILYYEYDLNRFTQ